jgi:hypothetical protein
VHSGTERTGADVFVRRWAKSEEFEALNGFTIYFADATDFVVKDADRRTTDFGASLAADLENSKFREAPTQGIEPVKPIVTSDGHIVMGVGTRVAWLGIEPPQSPRDGWAAKPSFPRFFAYLLDRVRALAPQDLVVHATGEPLLLPRPADAPSGARLVVTDPLGQAHAAEKTFTPLEPGIHKVRAEGGAQEIEFSAALLDRDAQDLSGAKTRPFAPAVIAALSARAERRESLPLAWVAALLALALAGVAWSLDSR